MYGWNKTISEDPANLNFWFDFLDTEGELGKYSVNKTDREKGFKFQALCAYKLKFTVPKEENISYLNGREFKAEKPEFLKMFM